MLVPLVVELPSLAANDISIERMRRRDVVKMILEFILDLVLEMN